ncbi:hypothetical protein C8A05DRAFT_38281, partial [Staphylotrichum tortipilum]
MAIADGALFGIHSLDDLWQQRIIDDDNEMPLLWDESASALPIARRVEHGKVTLQPMSEAKFRRMFNMVLTGSGYVERYTPAERSQHVLHYHPGIFDAFYAGNVSSCDGGAAFRNEKPDHSVPEYFRGIGQFRELGAPTQLPASMDSAIQQNPAVVELDTQARDAATSAERTAILTAKKNLLKKLRREGLAIDERQRWRHIHDCRRRSLAEELDIKHHDLVYCFYCSEWFQRGNDWDAHCVLELKRPPSKLCGAVTYRHTVVLPAFCLFCRQSENRLPSERLRYWERDADAIRHILKTHKLPTDCSECGVQSVSLEHLHDVHGYQASSGQFSHETTDPRAEPESFDTPTVPSSAAKVSTSEWWCGGGDVDMISGLEGPEVPDWFHGKPMP